MKGGIFHCCTLQFPENKFGDNKLGHYLLQLGSTGYLYFMLLVSIAAISPHPNRNVSLIWPGVLRLLDKVTLKIDVTTILPVSEIGMAAMVTRNIILR